MLTKFICPICWFDKLDEPAFDITGNWSQELCPCCWNQFWYNANPNNITDLRIDWIKKGCQFRSENKIKWWSHIDQLKNIWLYCLDGTIIVNE